jgi:hypothetical protein
MQKWLTILALLVALPFAVHAQTSGKPVPKPAHPVADSLAGYDRIITFNRQVHVVKIFNITFSEVRFTYPGQDKLSSINRSEISQILYADGRRDVFIALDDPAVKQKQLVDTSRIIVKSQKDWMKVIVTEDPAAISNLREVGKLKAWYESDKGSMGNAELMNRVAVVLKKKASVLQAHCVLVETKMFYKDYGELPRVEVTARAFGYK